MSKHVRQIVKCAMFVALGVVISNVLHFASTGIGRILSPMHFTVIICAMLLGWKYGMICGALTPLVSSLFGMPQIFPTGICMMFECCTYGFVSGILNYKLQLIKNEKLSIINIIITLIITMISGRIVGGIFNAIYYSMNSNTYTFKAYLDAYIIIQLPSIILQFILIPIIVNPLKQLEIEKE